MEKLLLRKGKSGKNIVEGSESEKKYIKSEFKVIKK